MDKTTSALSNGPILHPSKTELWTASLRKLEMLENGLSGVQRLDDLRRRQVLAWERGERLLVEALIADTTQPLTDDELLELIYAEVMLRAERGEVCATDEYVQRFPQFAESLQRLFAIHEALEAPASEPSEAVQPPQVNRPQISDVPRSSDRNLLFGIVALQMDFISRDALIEALRDWTTQKDKPLGEILVERGDLSAARRELLEPLVDEHVRRHDDDPAASLASISSVSEGTLNWHRVHDVDIAESLAVRRLNRGTRLPEGASASGHRATAAGAVRFRVLRPHSEGGLGCVLVALDEELHREVALKEIKPQFAKDLASRNRFTLEAEITGGLEHPGIVPVYGLGQYSDGRPYYAMRFIRGDSLKEAIERFHTGQHSQAAESKPVPSDVNADTVIGTRTMSAVTLPAEIPPRPVSAVDYASVEFRKLLGRFIDVCQAIEYAHSRGVLHRDLKPGNIMLGKYGETLVVDWGLAKVAGKEDRFANVDEATLVPSSGSSIENTAAGSVIGTPAYMSPEQAAGRLQQLGPATDVYSLGATLYHVLTGRSPFDKLPLPELLARVQCGEFPRPDEINARIPRALAAVCLRAMALQPTHRYQSAADIAEDLEHWLADEPVNAHREGPLARGARWVRKRRAWAMSGAAALALIAVVSSVAAVWINSERKTADSERQNAIVARAKAEAATNESLTMLADMQTERGLQFGREDDSATAASWFANAALLTPHDRKRQAANRLRARNWMNDAIVPAALLKLPNGPLRRIAFQPAGPLLLTLNATSLQIWDWRYEQALAWTESLADVTDAGWSPDGKQLAVAFGSGDVQVCEPTSGTVLRRFKHPERVESLLWSPDGQRVAVAGSRVQIWNVTEEPKCEYDWPHPNKVNALIFNQSGDRLATACEDNQARLFAVSDVPGQPAPLFAPVVHSPLNRCAPAFCQGDHQLVTVVRGGQPRWWEVDTGRDVTPEITVSKDSFDRKLVSSPDGQWIFAGGGNSCLVWNADGNSFALEHGNHVQDVAFDPQRSVLMTTCWDGKARLWTMPPSGRSPVTLPQMETYPGCALSTDGSFAAIAGASQVVIWQLRQQEVVVGYVEGWTDSRWLPRPGFDGRMATPGAWHGDPWGFQPRGNTLAVARMASGQPAGPPISLNGSLYDSCLCADNRSVAAACVAGQSGILSVFDVATGSPNFPTIRLPDLPISVAARPGQPQVAVLCNGGQLQVINTQNGLCELDLTHVDWLSGDKHSQVQYSPDGTALVSVTPANVVIVRDAETGRLRFPAIHPVVERGPCRTIAVSPDSRWLATGVTGKNVVQVWNLATGQPAGPALPHPGDFYGIFAVEFSPDGQWILSGHKDGRMRLWDWKAGNLVCPPMQHPGEVYDVKFTADGRYALAAVRLSTVHVWDLATGKLVAAPVRYEVPPGGATSGLGIAGSQVIASAPGYPVLDLSMLLSEPDAEIESLLAQAELSSNQKLQLGELVTLEQSEWNERWVTYATSRLTPEAAAEALARTLDESPNASARQMIAERAARTNLLERLLKLRPDVPQLHVVLAHELARKGDRTSAAKHRKIAVEAFQQSLGERLPDPSMASELARLMIEDLPLNWTKLEPTEMKAESGCTFTRQPDGSILAGPSTSQFDSYTIQCRNSLRRIAALRLDVLPHASLPGGGPGWVVGLFHLTELRAALRRADGTTVPLGIRSAASNKVRPLDDHTTTLQDGPWGVLDDNHATHWDIWPFAGMPHWLTLQFADPFEIAEADELIVQLEFRDPKHSGVRIGCFQLSVSGEEHVVETQQLIAAIRENAVSGVDALAAAHLVTGNSARAVDLLQPTVALARQNEAGTRLLLLAKAQHKLGQPAAARESCDQLIEWLRTNTPPRMLQQLTAEVVTEIGGLDRKQFHALLAQSVIEQELARLTREIETAPNSAAMYFARGQYLAQIGRWHASADDYQHEVKLIPENRLTWMYAAPVLILAGDEQGYRRHCRAMVTQFQGATDVGVADTVCKISLLLPDVIELSELPIQNMRDAASDPKWAAVRQYSQATCALISYREGNYEESIAWTKKLPNLTGHSGTLALVVRAMAEHQLGQADQSRKTLAQVETLIPIELRTVGTPEYIGPLPVPRANAHHDWLIAEVLRREAAALINGEPPKKD